MDDFDALVARLSERPGEEAVADVELLAQRASDEAIAGRKALVVRAAARGLAFNPQGRNPKQAFRAVLCKLCEDPADAEALAYVPVGLGFREKGDTFGKSALSRIFCQFGEHLPDGTRQMLFDEVTTYEGWLDGGTENHISMRRTAGFLFGERFPEATFAHGLTGAELAETCLDYMKAYGRSLYRNSMVEFLSPIYHAVHTAAWLNVVEFALNPDARLCARAILDYMLADLAANSHHAIIVPPCARAKGLMTDSSMRADVRSNTQWSAWLYWGAGSVPDTLEAIESTDTWHKSPLPLHAVSSYVPDPVIRSLGAKSVSLPYSLWQARSNREMVSPSQVDPLGRTSPAARIAPNPRQTLRSVYVSRNYALGAGIRTSDIEEPTLRHAHSFAVIWRAAASSPRNWLFFVHPYWYVNRVEGGEPLGLDDWSGTSPFLQMVHRENAAVLLFDIPDRDPHFTLARGDNPKWISDRPERPYPRAHAYVPDSVDETLDTEAGVFLRSGEVYVAIRSFGGRRFWERPKREGYRRLVIEGQRIGAAVEVGDRAEFGSFAGFCGKVTHTELDLTDLRASAHVRTRSTRGHRLDIRHNPDDWRPFASVNGVELDYGRWPTCESPYLTCRDGVMDVNDGRRRIRVDWTDALPVYHRTDLPEGA